MRSDADRKLAVINLLAVVVPIIGLVVALWLAWGGIFNLTHLAILAGMAFVSAVGITVGYHRLFTHASFKTPPWMRYLLAAAGSMAVQGPVIRWCAEHRRHHQHSDTEMDPHSPHMGEHGSWGEGILATLRGGYHAHVGWLFARRSRGLGRYSRDLRRDPVLVLVNRQFPWWVLAGLLIPAALGGAITLSWTGALLGLLWGGLVRIFVVHHITWSVNSICHIWGSRPFDCHDHSRNNVIVGVLAMGEGWHNNHHAFPSSARHGLRWWEFDLSYIIIRCLQAAGLASNLRRPDQARVERRRRRLDGRPAGSGPSPID